MAITIEGFTVVAKLEHLEALLERQDISAPNGTALHDEHLWKCSFMAHEDAQRFHEELGKLGLNISQGADPDAVIASEFNQEVDPYCEWLRMGTWEKAVIGWLDGTEPKSVVAKEGWDPKVGSGLVFHDPSTMQHLEFLRLDDDVEVFLNKKTGEELYIGRTSTPVDSLFKAATEVIRKHAINPGEPTLEGESAEKVRQAVEQMDRVLEEEPDWWNALWFHGKGHASIGNNEHAYQSFQKAFALEKTVEAIPRELGGVCLELGKFDEAVSVAEHAVGLETDNPESLGNLAISYLMAQRYDAARKAIDAALKLSPDDKINQTIARILTEIEEGRRDTPKSLGDLSKPARPKKKKKFLGLF